MFLIANKKEPLLKMKWSIVDLVVKKIIGKTMQNNREIIFLWV